MLSRFSSAALSGTSTERKTSISSSERQQQHGADEHRQAFADASAHVGEARRLAADVGPGRAVAERAREHVGAQPGDGVGRGLVLRAGGRERRPGSRCPLPGRSAAARRRRCPRSAPTRRATGASTPGSRRESTAIDERAVGARAEALGDEVVGPALGPVLGQ